MKFSMLALLILLLATCSPCFAQSVETDDAEFFVRQSRKLKSAKPKSGDRFRPGSWIVSAAYGVVAGSVKGTVKAANCAHKALDPENKQPVSTGQWADDDLEDQYFACSQPRSVAHFERRHQPEYEAAPYSNYLPIRPQYSSSQRFQSVALAQGYGYGWTNPHVQHVNGYYRSNGTYVRSHWKTVANATMRDNFSVKGNRNPFTGKIGHIRAKY